MIGLGYFQYNNRKPELVKQNKIMKIYKATYRHQEASEGFYFASSLQKAKTNALNGEGNNITHCEKEIQVIEVIPNKKGIIAALNFHASHNDNG